MVTALFLPSAFRVDNNLDLKEKFSKLEEHNNKCYMMDKQLAGIMVGILLMAGLYAEGQEKNKAEELHLTGRINTLKISCFSASDSSGTIIRSKEILYSHAPVIIYKFRDSGLPEEKTEFDSDTSFIKHVYMYNERGNQTEDIVLNSDGTIREVTFHLYDEKGNLERCENKVVGKNEKLLRKEDYMRVKGPYRKMVYTYDEKGNKTCETIYDIHGSRSVVYTCDGKGNITGHKFLNEEGKTEKCLTYSYDERKNPVECQQFDGDGNLQSRIVFKYDINNLLTEETEFAPDGSVRNTIRYVYEYDSHNNWIRQITFRNEVPLRIAEREIAYF